MAPRNVRISVRGIRPKPTCSRAYISRDSIDATARMASSVPTASTLKPRSEPSSGRSTTMRSCATTGQTLTAMTAGVDKDPDGPPSHDRQHGVAGGYAAERDPGQIELDGGIGRGDADDGDDRLLDEGGGNDSEEQAVVHSGLSAVTPGVCFL